MSSNADQQRSADGSQPPDPLHTPMTEREIEEAAHGEAFLGLGDERPLSDAERHAATARATFDAQSGVDDGSDGLPHFDVIIAEVLDPPFRHIQNYLWMTVAAPSPQQAILQAYGYAESSDRVLEVPGLYRDSDDHPETIHGLRVDWTSPVPRLSRSGTLVRHPVSGLRLGFVATDKARERLLPQATPGFGLLTRKPSDVSEAVCLVPLVDSAEPGSPD